MAKYFPIILGTARVGSNSHHVANFIQSKVTEAGYETDLIIAGQQGLTHTERGVNGNAALEAISKQIARANGLIVVTPEYNHGYPGELKLLLDVFVEEYKFLPFGFVGVGALMGGGRAIEQLRQILPELSAFSTHDALYFPAVWTLFDQDGTLKDAKAYDERVKKFLAELDERSR